MSVIEIFKPVFDKFQDTPIVTWREPKGGRIRVETNMFEQYKNWLHAWTDPSRDRHAPGSAFWESCGPMICRALLLIPVCSALVFEYEGDRKVSYRWFTRKPERPTSYSNDWYNVCSVKAEGNVHTGEGRVTVTLPSDEDVNFYFHAHTMKEYLKHKQKTVEAPAP